MHRVPYKLLLFLLFTGLLQASESLELLFPAFNSESLREALQRWRNSQIPNGLLLPPPHLRTQQQLTARPAALTVDQQRFAAAQVAQPEIAFLPRLPIELQRHIAFFLEENRDVYALAESSVAGYAATRDLAFARVVLSVDDINEPALSRIREQYLYTRVLVVRVSSEDRTLTVGNIALLARYFPEITTLEFEDLIQTSLARELAKYFKNLKKLTISGGITDAALAELANAEFAKNLQVLRLGSYISCAKREKYAARMGNFVNHMFAFSIFGNTNTRSKRPINTNFITETGVTAIINGFPELRELDISGSYVNSNLDTIVNLLAESHLANRLTFLGIANFCPSHTLSIEGMQTIVAKFLGLRGLRFSIKLDLYSYWSGYMLLKLLATSSLAAQLEDLGIYYDEVLTDKELALIAQSFPKLTALLLNLIFLDTVADTNAESAESGFMTHFRNAVFASALRQLDLSRNNLSDADARELAEIFPDLRRLFVTHNRLGYNGVLQLLQLRNLVRLSIDNR